MNRSPLSAFARSRPLVSTALAMAVLAALSSRIAVATEASLANIPALAEQGDGGPKRTIDLKAVTVEGVDTSAYAVGDSTAATKLDLSLRETPQSVTVITRQRLDDQNLTSLRQVLDNTAGVYSNAYDTERVLFYSRGFLIDTLMYDGVPATTNFNTGSIDETLDTALYDRIEVVRGATGLMSGAGSPGASINLVRKHAVEKTPTLSVDLSAGSWNDGRVQLDASVPLNASGSVRARGVAVYEDQDSYQALYHKKTDVLYGIVDWNASPTTLLSLGFDHQDNRPRGNTWGSFPLFLSDGSKANWPRSVSTATDWSHWTRRTDTLFGELRHSFDNDWVVHASANVRRYREDVQLFYVYGFPNPATGEGLEPYAYKSRGEIIDRAVDLYASGPFDAFGRTHELVVGYGGSRTSNTGSEYNLADTLPGTGNFFDWDGSYPKPAFPEQGTPLNDIDTTQNGFYAAARWSLADPLTLITGARRATWNVDSFYIYDTPANSKYDFKKTIPYAGLVYDLGKAYSLFVSYTGIFKPQNARNVDGHHLDPIDGRSVEVGIKGEHLDGRLTTSLILFRTRQDNVAAPVYDPTTGEPLLLPDGSQVSRPLDGTDSRGFELEVAGRLGDDWQTSFGFSRTLMHDATGTNVRTYIPGTLLRTFTTWTPRAWVEGLTLGAGLNWQSRSSTLVGAPAGSTVLRQASVVQLALMAKYDFSPRVSLQFNANNVLDRKYYVLDEYDNTYYGAPANVSLSLHLAL
jgi:outer membrane receptor for ferric coprogen and ferric-rhodotorulic acid